MIIVRAIIVLCFTIYTAYAFVRLGRIANSGKFQLSPGMKLDKMIRGSTPRAASDLKESSATEALEQSLKKLRAERERKRAELMTAEIAVRQAEAEYRNHMNMTAGMSRGSYDYGFTSKSNGVEPDAKNRAGDGVPSSALSLALRNFRRELGNIIETVKSRNNGGVEAEEDEMRRKLKQLKLSNEAIWERERNRPEIKSPWIIKAPYYVLCVLLDNLFNNNPIQRFYFLETVARMPYFSYITMLHTYETLGWWRRSTEAKRVHFAEEFNEYNHLLIMESLGGDQEWNVRFLAQHSAIVYYFVLLGMWVISPSLAYNFSELIEAHAVDTYAEFAESNKDLLLTMEAPKVARDYYESPDLYIFDEFQTGIEKGSRRPLVNSLYDVFCNIRDDEAAHVATMSACQDTDVVIRSPNTEAALVSAAAAAALAVGYLSNPSMFSGVGVDSITDVLESARSSIVEAVSGVVAEGSAAVNTAATTAVSEVQGQASLVESVSSAVADLTAAGEAGAQMALGMGEQVVETAVTAVEEEDPVEIGEAAIGLSVLFEAFKRLLILPP